MAGNAEHVETRISSQQTISFSAQVVTTMRLIMDEINEFAADINLAGNIKREVKSSLKERSEKIKKMAADVQTLALNQNNTNEDQSTSCVDLL